MYPNRYWVVFKNHCQIFGYPASELLSYVWGIPHLIGLGETQNLSPPNKEQNLRYLLSQCFCAFSVQLHHLVPTILIYLPGILNLELGCKEAWGIHTGGGGSDGDYV